MRKSPGSRGTIAMLVLVLLCSATAAFAQTPTYINAINLPDAYVNNGTSYAYPVLLTNGDEVDQVSGAFRFVPGTKVRIDSVSIIGSRLNGLGAITKGFNAGERRFWFSFDANNGTPLPAGEGLVATVHFYIFSSALTHDVCLDTSTFNGFTYTIKNPAGDNIIEGLDPGVIHITTQRPVIGVDPDHFALTTDEGVNPPQQFLNITNIGGGTLNWDLSHKPTFMNSSAMSGTAPSALILTVDVTGMAAGVYHDSIVVHDDFADPKFRTVHVDLTINEANLEITRCINLHSGWNLISWNVNTPDDDIETIIADIKGCIDGVYGFEIGALSYDPDLPQFSTLDKLDHLHGYWFRMNCDTVLCVTGQKVAVGTPIGLEPNWNLVGYLPDEDNAPAAALQSMLDNLIVALGYDNGGLTYDPASPNLASLEYMKRDFGYWLKCTEGITLQYPSLVPTFGSDGASISLNRNATVDFGFTPTREWVNLYGEALTLDGQLIKAGSRIELFDESGNLCGKALVGENGRLQFTPVYFDDKSTSIDEGIEPGGRVSVSINGEPVSESFSYSGFGDQVQLGDLNSVVKLSDALPGNYSLNQNYPNPFNPSTLIEFSMPQSGHARIEVFNLLGEKIEVLMDRNLATGRYSVLWNGHDQSGNPAPSGIYFYRLTSGEFSLTRKMMLVK